MSRSATIPPPTAAVAEKPVVRKQTTALHAGAWATADQVVFSAGNFLTTVLIGRWAGAKELGGYSLVFACILVAAAFQRALVTSPYTYLSQHWSGRRRSIYRGSALVHAACLSVAVGVVLALSLILIPGISRPISSAVAVAGALVCWGMQDFCRRTMFADHRFRDVLYFDLFTMGLHVGMLVTLFNVQRLTATTAILSLAVACGICVIPWLILNRSLFIIRPRRIRRDLIRNWSFGRWGALSEVTFISQDFGVQALLAAFGGMALTGAYAACMSLVRLANPFVQAVGNAVGPLSARALASGGVNHLVTGVMRVTWMMLIALGIYVAVIFVAGQLMLNALYGDQFSEQANLLLPLAVAAAITAMGLAPAKAISAMRMPRMNLWSHLTGLIITLSLIWMSYTQLGIYSVALGVLLGASFASLLKWYFFLALTNVAALGKEPSR